MVVCLSDCLTDMNPWRRSGLNIWFEAARLAAAAGAADAAGGCGRMAAVLAPMGSCGRITVARS